MFLVPCDVVRSLAADSLAQDPGRYEAWQHGHFRCVRPNSGQRVGVHDDEAIVGIALELRNAEDAGTATTTHQGLSVHPHHVVLHLRHAHWLGVRSLTGVSTRVVSSTWEVYALLCRRRTRAPWSIASTLSRLRWSRV